MNNHSDLKFCPELRRLFVERRTRGRSGKEFERIGALSTEKNVFVLRRIVMQAQPARTLEIGLAFAGLALAIARIERVFHDGQPDTQESDVTESSCMELVKPHYVMTQVLGRCGIWNHFRLVVRKLFRIAAGAADESTRSRMSETAVRKVHAIAHPLGIVKVRGRSRLLAEDDWNQD